jgi:competence protein ComFC
LTRSAAAFDYFGPAATLVQQLKFARRVFLAKEIAAFLVIQLFRLGWPLPDLLVPVPQSWIRRLSRGFNQSQLIAQEMGALLNRPSVDLLKRRSGDFAQVGLDRQQREALSAQAFSWKRAFDLSDQTVLLIDDVMTTGRTLGCSAEILQESFPKAIYGLTCCLG